MSASLSFDGIKIEFLDDGPMVKQEVQSLLGRDRREDREADRRLYSAKTTSSLLGYIRISSMMRVNSRAFFSSPILWTSIRGAKVHFAQLG